MKQLAIHPILFSRLIMLGLLLVGVGGYLINEPSVWLRLSVVGLSAVSAVFLLLRRRVAFPTMLTLYLLAVLLINWYFVASGPLVVAMMMFAALTVVLSLIFFYNEGLSLLPVQGLVIGLLSAEVFLIYAFFLIGPTAIGILLLCFVYVLWGMLLLSAKDELTVNSAATYLVLATVFTLLTLYSTQLQRS